MDKEKVEPTYIGENESLVFVVPSKLFTMKVGGEKIDRELAKEYSSYLKGTFKGFQKANKTKYDNGDNNKIETTPEFWEEFEKLAKNGKIDLSQNAIILQHKDGTFTNIVITSLFTNMKGQMWYNSGEDICSVYRVLDWRFAQY